VKGHHAVPSGLIGNAAGLFNCITDSLKGAVEEKDNIIGQLMLRNTGKTAQISEQNSNLFFLAS
jgi:hypothetical protein